MNSVRSNNISLKYQRDTTLGSKDIGIRKSEFVAKTQFLFSIFAWELDTFKLQWYVASVIVFRNINGMRLHGCKDLGVIKSESVKT